MDNKSDKCTKCGCALDLPSQASGVCSECRAAGGAPLKNDLTKALDEIEAGAGYEEIEPSAYLPFKMTKQQAEKKFGQWLRGIWFAPSKIQDMIDRNEFTGTYIPFWSFDCKVEAGYLGSKGTISLKSKQDMEGRSFKKKELSWATVSGDVDYNFYDLLIPANESMGAQEIARISPWDLDGLLAYEPKAVETFNVESCQVELPEAFKRAKRSMIKVMRQLIKEDIGGDEQEISTETYEYPVGTYQRILLPIWVSSYTYNGKSYRVLINGRTGRITGERPRSWQKIAIATVVPFLVLLGGLWYLLS